ncbi:hypothetical protein ACWKTZ_20200 [Bacillus cereus]
MNIQDILKELKDILPPENFKVQPQEAIKVVREYENKYGINTETFLLCKDGVGEDDCDSWLSAYQTMLLFGGEV